MENVMEICVQENEKIGSNIKTLPICWFQKSRI